METPIPLPDTGESGADLQLLSRAMSLELLTHLAAMALLGYGVWHALSPTTLLATVGAVTVVYGWRLAAGGRLQSAANCFDHEMGVTALRMVLFGNIIAGCLWGSLPWIARTQGWADALPFTGAIPILLIGVVVATLAGSTFVVSLFLGFAVPALAIPMLTALKQGAVIEVAAWGAALYLACIVSHTAAQLARVHIRDRQVARQNSQLVTHLAESRNQAERTSREMEQGHQALKLEIRERERMQGMIRASEQELNRILTDMVDIYFRVDANCRLTRISASCEARLGYTPEELIGRSFKELFVKLDDCEGLVAMLSQDGGAVNNVEVCFAHKRGTPVWSSINARHVNTAGSADNGGFEGTLRDVTEGKQAQEELHRQKERLRVTLESIGDAVITTGVDGLVKFMNHVAEDITGWPAAEAASQPLHTVLKLFDEDTRKPVRLPIKHWLLDGHRVSLAKPAILVSRGEDKSSSIELTGAPIRDSKGGLIGTVLVFRNVTKLRTLAKQLSYQATHDALTGLVNRSEFEARVEQAIRSAQGEGKIHALCYVDLDQFKVVNDTCGHHAGDELLKQITTLFRGVVRDADMLARLGGDEFGLLLVGCPMDQAAKIAEELRARVEQYRFIWDDRAFRVGTSIGLIAITQDTQSLTELLSAADSACYVAKERGRNQVHMFLPNDQEVAHHHGQMQWMQRIQSALENDQFELYFQPIVSLRAATAREQHIEILLRMQDPQRKGGELIVPNAFLPAAERYHLMPEIDRWVVRNVMHALAAQRSTLDTCSINLSGQSLGDLKLFDYIVSLLEKTGVPPTILCFEITESAVISNIGVARDFMLKLKALGCRFALDDFGAGLSSFAYLKNLPVDYVKLDGALVRDVATDTVSLAMVQAMNQVAHVMGMRTIAEYVESESAINALRSIAVDYIQGYAVGYPQPFISPLARPASGVARVETTEA